MAALNSSASPHHYGPWALVCGASEGLGAAFASQLAQAGFHLVLVARRAGPLEAYADSLRQAVPAEHRTQVVTVALDLSTADAPQVLLDTLSSQGTDIGLLVYNAALSVSGDFIDVPLATHQAAMQVNVLTPMALVHSLGGDMARRGCGGIVLMSSLSGTAGTAALATYASTKAFNNAFGEALWDELRTRGVDVVVSVAGSIATPGYEARTPAKLPAMAPKPLQPAAVAEDALAALGKRPRTIPGFGNRVALFMMNHFMSRKQAVVTMGKAGRAVHLATQPATQPVHTKDDSGGS